MGFGVPVIGSYGRFSQQKVLWSHSGHLLGVFLLLPVFFNAWGRKKSIKSHRIGKIVARTHEVNEVKCFHVFPSLLEKKKKERREDKRPDRRFHLPPGTIK